MLNRKQGIIIVVIVVVLVVGWFAIAARNVKKEADNAVAAHLVITGDTYAKQPGDQLYYVDLGKDHTVRGHLENGPVEELSIDAARQKLLAEKDRHTKNLMVIVKVNDAGYKDIMKMIDMLTKNNISRYSLQN